MTRASDPKGDAKDNARDVLATVADVGLGEILEPGEAIPIFGLVVKSLRAGKSVRDILLLYKLKKFCEPLQQASEKDRGAFALKMRSDRKLFEQVSRLLFLKIDLLDDERKARILGIAFRAYIEGDFGDTFENVSRVARGLHLAYHSDVDAFLEATDPLDRKVVSPHTQEALATAGFLAAHNVVHEVGEGAYPHYQITDLGERLRSAWESAAESSI